MFVTHKHFAVLFFLRSLMLHKLTNFWTVTLYEIGTRVWLFSETTATIVAIHYSPLVVRNK